MTPPVHLFLARTSFGDYRWEGVSHHHGILRLVAFALAWWREIFGKSLGPVWLSWLAARLKKPENKLRLPPPRFFFFLFFFSLGGLVSPSLVLSAQSPEPLLLVVCELLLTQ
jgi:hypothetical protein